MPAQTMRKVRMATCMRMRVDVGMIIIIITAVIPRYRQSAI